MQFFERIIASISKAVLKSIEIENISKILK